jgi:hypothetical protein
VGASRFLNVPRFFEVENWRSEDFLHKLMAGEKRFL